MVEIKGLLGRLKSTNGGERDELFSILGQTEWLGKKKGAVGVQPK
jgi:hypothetical protein